MVSLCRVRNVMHAEASRHSHGRRPAAPAWIWQACAASAYPFRSFFPCRQKPLNASQRVPSHRNLPEKGTHAAAACIRSACDTVAFIIACVTSGENDASSLTGYYLFSRSAAALFRRRQRHCRTVRHGGVSLRSDSKMPFTAACCARAKPRGYGRWSGA